MLVNLAVNARDAMPRRRHADDRHRHRRRRRRVRRQPGRTWQPAGTCGCGCPTPAPACRAEVVDRAFEPFFTTKPSGEGTGLGLATVYGIITQAGGTVHIYSEPGLGTTITVLLPATEPSSRPSRPTPAADRDLRGARARRARGRGRGRACAQVTSRILRRGGYKVLIAEDGPDALELAGEHPEPIDLLLTDVVMPRHAGQGGGRTGSPASAGSSRCSTCPGTPSRCWTRTGTLDPDVDLLEKPFTSTELLAAVQDLYLSQ